MEAYVLAILQAVTAIIVAYIGKKTADEKKDREKRQKIEDERDARREQREKFLLDYMDLSADLAEAQTIAIVEGKHNGELSHAQERLTKLREKYAEWLRQIAVKE